MDIEETPNSTAKPSMEEKLYSFTKAVHHYYSSTKTTLKNGYIYYVILRLWEHNSLKKKHGMVYTGTDTVPTTTLLNYDQISGTIRKPLWVCMGG